MSLVEFDGMYEWVSQFISPLTHFEPMFHFYTPWGFLMFSGGIEVEHWLKMGS